MKNPVSWRRAAAVAAVIIAVACAATVRAADLSIHTPNGIDEERFLQIGGVSQWVTIRGEDRTNPILLIVGGVGVDGPGAVLSPFIADLRPLERDYVVVTWDERGVGKTFAAAGQTLGPDLGVDLLVRDGLDTPVEAQQVVLIQAETADGCLRVYPPVRSMPVVAMEPDGQLSGALV